VALTLAFFVNAAILILAAATFFSSGHNDIADIGQAYQLLAPLLGVGLASVLFGVALLASGQNSTVTATLAGQVILEGFMHIKLKPWIRRLVTRLLAIVPAVIIALAFGGNGLSRLLIFSQIVLSMQLPFAVLPLIYFTSSKKHMGEFTNRMWLKMIVWSIAAVIVILNGWLVLHTFLGV
jgi:manganese transport protein